MIIRTLREDRGWSQEQLAEVSGVSVRTIQRIETGRSGSLETLKCLAAVFETSIPELREENTVTDDKEPIEINEPVPEPAPQGLTSEDKAALKYARNLRRYDDTWDDQHGWGDGLDMDTDVPMDQQQVIKQVRRERGFYQTLAVYCAIVALSFAVNLLTNPSNIWAGWTAIGFGTAAFFQGLDVFGRKHSVGENWERREVEKRLQRLSNTSQR